MAVTDNRLNFARYNRLIQTLIPRVMRQVHQWLYKSSLTLKEYLHSEKKMGLFDAAEKELINNEVDLNQMDVKLLYKLLKETCKVSAAGKPWYKKPKDRTQYTLGNFLHELKTYRNKTCHPKPEEILKISDEELDKTVSDLKDIFKRTLTLAGKENKKEGKIDNDGVEAVISKVNKDLQDERDAESGLTASQFIEMAHNELLNSEGILPSSDKYLPPRLLAEELGTSHDVQVQELSFKEMFVHKCKDGSRPDHLVLVGETGAGKTSLCKNVIRNWLLHLSEIQGLADYQLVLGFHCAQVFTSDLNYLLSTKLLPKTYKSCYNAAELTRIMSKIRILWVVDGWDEKTAEAKNLVLELLALKQDTHTVLVTSRPEASHELLEKCPALKKAMKLQFAILNTKEKEDLLNMNIDDQINVHIEISLESLLMNPEVTTPLQLVLLARLWVECKEGLELHNNLSLTQLYARILKHQKSRLTEKCKHEVSSDRAVMIVDEFFASVCEVAFNDACKGPDLKLDDKSMRILKEKCQPLTSSICFSTFFDLNEISKSKVVYAFSQPSQRLFFAALHLGHICSRAKHPETTICNKLKPFIARNDFIDPFLGVYDIFYELTDIAGILCSKLTFGRLLSFKQNELSSRVTRVARKMINLATFSHSPYEENESMKSLNFYYPVLNIVLQMIADNTFEVTIPSKCLVHLLDQGIGEESDPYKWFEVIRNGCFQQDLVREVSSRMNLELWCVEENCLRAACELLDYVAPKEMKIEISVEPQSIPELEKTLCKLVNTPVTLSLHFNRDFNQLRMESTSANYLEVLCKHGAKCRLISFLGHLTKDHMEYLVNASHMKTLTVRVTKKDALNLLTCSAQSFKRLQNLNIYYDRSNYFEPKTSLDGSLGILRFLDGRKVVQLLQGSRFLNVQLYLPHLKDASVKSAISFISKLNKRYNALEVGGLEYTGVKSLVSGLSNNAVSVSNLIRLIYVPKLNRHEMVNFGSLPLQVPLREFVEKWHDIQKGILN